MKIVRPSASTLLVSLITSRFLLLPSRRLRSVALAKRLVALLFLLNWRNWPFWWHIDLWGSVLLLRLRILRHGPVATLSIGRSPFRTILGVSNARNTFAYADWNMHMSNSSYARVLDKARFVWLLELVGPAMGREAVWSPLATTSFAFYDELPLGASFDVRVDVVSWDDKWIYYRASFVGVGNAKLYAVAMCKSCFKLRGSGLSIPPASVMSISGVGEGESNWRRATTLRKRREARKWLMYRGLEAAKRAGKPVRQTIEPPTSTSAEGVVDWDSDGLEMFEDQRRRNLETVSFLAQADSWRPTST